MATSRELQALLRPLLTRRCDLGFVGRTLFLQPFTHYLQCLAFYLHRCLSIYLYYRQFFVHHYISHQYVMT